MAAFGKVIGGQFVNSTVSLNLKGQLALRGVGFKRTPNLIRESVDSWEEVANEASGGAVDAISKMGQAAAMVALPGAAGKAASAAVDSAVVSMKGNVRSVRVKWTAGGQSLIELPEKLFLHLSVDLEDLRTDDPSVDVTANAASSAAESVTSGVIGQLTQLAGAVRPADVDVTEQIAKFAALRDQGALTEEEFAAKKAELLGISSSTPSAPQTVSETEPDSSPLIPDPPAPPSWGPDPHGKHEHRYWDGSTWTEHVSNGGIRTIDPV